MFTGIIEELGEITAIQEIGGGRKLTIRASFTQEVRVDESVAINGACMTVVERGTRTFSVVAVEESLRKTTFGLFQPGQSVNLERALPLGGRLDGHLVQGHVDGLGVVTKVEKEQTNRLYTIRYAPAFSTYLIPVGSVAVDGISLTVARLEEKTFTVAIIPHTFEHTNVKTWNVGSLVNLEFDLIGKYVARHVTRKEEVPAPPVGTEYAWQWLREMGIET